MLHTGGGGRAGASGPRTQGPSLLGRSAMHPEPGVPTRASKTPSSLTVTRPGRGSFCKGTTQPRDLLALFLEQLRLTWAEASGFPDTGEQLLRGHLCSASCLWRESRGRHGRGPSGSPSWSPLREPDPSPGGAGPPGQVCCGEGPSPPYPQRSPKSRRVPRSPPGLPHRNCTHTQALN